MQFYLSLIIKWTDEQGATLKSEIFCFLLKYLQFIYHQNFSYQ